MLNKNKFPSMLVGAFALLVIIGCSALGGKSESEIRSSVVELVGDRGLCSGVQVRSKSGAEYILSAAHCLHINSDQSQVKVITEDGRTLNRRIIAEDAYSDLLLIESVPGTPSLKIALNSNRFENVRSFTHGRGMPTYETHGHIVGEQQVQTIINLISSEKERDECQSKPKYAVVDTGIFGLACMINVQETVVTAGIVPGSSGGPIVDSEGDLVGIASMTDGNFGYLVRLIDIKSFIRNY